MTNCESCVHEDAHWKSEPCIDCFDNEGYKAKPEVALESINEKLDKIMECLGIKG